MAMFVIVILSVIVIFLTILKLIMRAKYYYLVNQNMINLRNKYSLLDIDLKLLTIDYASPQFQNLNIWLSERTDEPNQQFIIVLHGPYWLKEIKQNSWKNHIIIGLQDYMWGSLALLKKDRIFIQTRNKKMIGIDEIEQYFEQFILQAEEPLLVKGEVT